MNKTAKALLIVFVIFNLIFSLSGINNVKAFSSEGDFNKWDKDGTVNATVDGSEKTVSTEPTHSSPAGVVGILAEILMFLPSIVSTILTNVVTEELFVENFTIQALVMGNYDIFNINFLEVDSSNVSDEQYESRFNNLLKDSVAKYYYLMRNIALFINLFVLIYIGIRMAVSTLAEQKAKYKKMLVGWVLSIIMIFLMHYVIILALELSEWILKIILKIGQSTNQDPSFESNIVDRIDTNYSSSFGFSTIPSIIIYWIVVYYQTKFFIMYSFRTLEVAILIITSPLITVTYSIDSVKDGKSQVFNAWLKILLEKIFLQDLHCLAYFVFIVTASAIAEKAPLLAVLFFMSLSRIEGIVKNLFNMKDKGIKDIKLPFFNK